MLLEWLLHIFLALAASVGILFAGQAPASHQADNARTIKFWVGDNEDYESSGIQVGCGDFLLPVDTGVLRSGDTTADLTVALNALFSADWNHPATAPFYNWIKQLELELESIAIDEGAAVVTLAGGLMGIGTCGDAILEAQIIQTVFQFETIQRVMVTDGVMNLWEITDQSDRLSEEERVNYVYVRPEN